MCWVVQLSQRRLCQVHLHAPCPFTLAQPWAKASPTTLHLPGFKFSRASYLLSLLRPQIYAELELQVLLLQHPTLAGLPACPSTLAG